MNNIAGFRIVIQTANEPRRTIYRKGHIESVAVHNAEYISGFIRLVEVEPLNSKQWKAKP